MLGALGRGPLPEACFLLVFSTYLVATIRILLQPGRSAGGAHESAVLLTAGCSEALISADSSSIAATAAGPALCSQ